MKMIAILFGVVAVASSVGATIAAFRMGVWLSHHGVKVNWFWFRVLIPRYVDQYKKMTTDSEGRAGPLFVPFVVMISVALLFAVATIVTIVASKG